MIKSDKWLRKMATECEMIQPFEEKQVQQGVISYGVASYGYDMRLANKFRLLEASSELIADPKAAAALTTREIEAVELILPPQSLVWGQSLEYFRIPRTVVAIVQGKSTYARLGLIVNVTPFDPEWEGFATLTLVNPMPYAIKLYAGEGIGQVLFFESDEICEVSYADKQGKYHQAQEIQLSRVKS